MLLSLLVALAAAQATWSDVVMSFYQNITQYVVKMCEVDYPTTCKYVPKLNMSLFPNVTSSYFAQIYTSTGYVYNFYPPDYVLLQYIAFMPQDIPKATVYIPGYGIIHSSQSFYVDGKAAGPQPPICGMTIAYGVVVAPGWHNITNIGEQIRWLDPTTCISYRLIDYASRVMNITGTAYLFFFYMPTATKQYSVTTSNGVGMTVLNGSAHAYYFPSSNTYYIASGFYLANSTWLPAAVVQVRSGYAGYGTAFTYGPVHYSAYSNATLYIPSAYAMYTIGPDPGDGIIPVSFLNIALEGKLQLSFIADNMTGYVQLPGALPSMLNIYVRRYALAEFAVSNGTYTYDMRLVACPGYVGQGGMTQKATYFVPPRLDRANEVEICNNTTKTYYVGIYVSASVTGYAWFDELDPGACRMLRWDGIYSSSQVTYNFFNSTYYLCENAPQFSLAGSSCPAGWRCYLNSSNALVPTFPVDLDTLYAAMWSQFMQSLAQQYNATMSALQQWLNMQANATKSVTAFMNSLPRLVGTIKMDSATSTWLNTTLKVLKSYQVSGASAQYGTVALPPAPLVIAPAASAAVAIAWAASRRDEDLTVTAAATGIALALFGVLMTLLYGTASLSLVALGVIIAAAAAAWRRSG